MISVLLQHIAKMPLSYGMAYFVTKFWVSLMKGNKKKIHKKSILSTDLGCRGKSRNRGI